MIKDDDKSAVHRCIFMKQYTLYRVRCLQMCCRWTTWAAEHRQRCRYCQRRRHRHRHRQLAAANRSLQLRRQRLSLHQLAAACSSDTGVPSNIIIYHRCSLVSRHTSAK